MQRPGKHSGSRDQVVGYAVDTRTCDECVNDIIAWVRGGEECRWLACLNPHSYVVSLDDPEFSDALRGAEWLIPDGVGVVLASKLLGGRIGARITGSDIFAGVHRRLNEGGGGRVFFLGSSEAVLATIRARMAVEFPKVAVVGTYSPPFQPTLSKADVAAMVDAINGAAPDVLWVGLTAPKQEKWIHQNRHRLNVRFAAAVGAVFDFYAGRIKRSHPLFRRLGLEWLPRFAQEPRRLWRRTLVSAPIFAVHVLRSLVRQRSD